MERKLIQNFTDLHAWQESHVLVMQVYKVTGSFPSGEQYSLTDQMRRAAVSITSNIAEGFGRSSFSEKAHFYTIARGSLTELQNQLIVARDLEYIATSEFQMLYNQSIVSHKLITGLTKSTRKLANS